MAVLQQTSDPQKEHIFAHENYVFRQYQTLLLATSMSCFFKDTV